MINKVLVYPKESNPYQELLYNQVRKKMEIRYLVPLTQSKSLGLFFIPLQLINYRIKGYKFFHLHWVFGFTFPGNNFLSKFTSSIYYYFILLFIKICGYRIIWTVHNILPHNNLFLNDIAARRFLSKIASIKIIHSPVTIEMMRKYKFSIKNYHVVPLGNYINIYPNYISKSVARRRLKINQKAFVFLYFGKIERYKGVLNLLKQYLSLNNPNTILIVAGQCEDDELRYQIKKYENNKRIQLYINYIKDEEVQNYFNASNIIVCPFSKITTSSTVILAFSFKKTIMYPAIGNLKDIPPNIGCKYNYLIKDGLKQKMSWVIQNRNMIEIWNKNAFNFAKSLSWNKAADKTYEIYKNL